MAQSTKLKAGHKHLIQVLVTSDCSCRVRMNLTMRSIYHQPLKIGFLDQFFEDIFLMTIVAPSPISVMNCIVFPTIAANHAIMRWFALSKTRRLQMYNHHLLCFCPISRGVLLFIGFIFSHCESVKSWRFCNVFICYHSFYK